MDKAPVQTRLVSISASMVLLASFWPVWCWYVQRSFDRSDEPWGILALATAGYFVARAGKEFKIACRSNSEILFTALSVLTYILTFAFAPHLVQGIIMVATLWFWFGGRLRAEWRWGILGLLLLALPIVPSINFFAGYPLRLLITQAAQWILACVGIAALKSGTLLVIAGKAISVDAPCSGIGMLWVGIYTAMALACYFKLNLRCTAILTGASFALILLSNSIRVVALILLDLICQMPAWGKQVSAYEHSIHVGVGVIAFFFTAAATAYLALKLSLKQEKRQDAAGSLLPNFNSSKFLRPASALLCALCICAGLLPVLAPPTTGVQLSSTSPEWPRKILGNSVTAVQVLGEEKAFAADFPGHMRRFTDGTNSYFVRVVDKETRQLHPSSDCFRGMGYGIESQPLVVSSDGSHWSSFIARKGNASYLIMEQLHDNHGRTWTDVSEWYWYALMHESDGPWWAITVARPH